MRLSVFAKIFLGFWLISVAVLASWLLSSQYFDSLRFAGAERHHPEGPPPRRLLRLVWALEDAPAGRITGLLESASKEHNVALWLLAANGVDWRGQTPPAAAQAVAAQLQENRRRARSAGRNPFYVAHLVERPDDRKLRLVVSLGPPPPRVLGMLGTSPVLRMLLAMLVSGLACWGLSRALTHRLGDLRQASRALADGDLSVRIAVRDHGGDETDELARDFNAMADQLADRMAAQKQLLSDVSHELRSPLARLRVAIALAQDDNRGAAEYLLRMEKECERLESLISQLLTSEERSFELREHLDLVTLLGTLCQDANFEGENDEKRVLLNSSLTHAVVATSDDLLRRSFDNLIRNALHYTAPATTVTVTLARENNCFRIDIEDRGPGIEESHLTRIFDPFYRVDQARSREAGGYGLGLAIAQRAISAHGGTVVACNSGTGLRMTVHLPVYEESGDESAAQ